MADLNNITGVYEGAWTPAKLVGSTWTRLLGVLPFLTTTMIRPPFHQHWTTTRFLPPTAFTTVGNTVVTGNVLLEQQSLTG